MRLVVGIAEWTLSRLTPMLLLVAAADHCPS